MRHPDSGANHCRSALSRPRTPARAPDRRRPRPAGRYRDGNERVGGAPESRTPRTALRERRCHRGQSRAPEPAAGIRRRTAEPGPARPAGVAFRLPAAWVSCAHLQMVPCLRRGAPAGDTLHESGGNAVPCVQLHFPMPSVCDAYRRGHRQGRIGPCVLPSPLLLVSGPGPVWIMPTAGIFMRAGHAAMPECMAPPRIARPQPRGESGGNCAALARNARRRAPSTAAPRPPSPRGFPLDDVRPERFVDRAPGGTIPAAVLPGSMWRCRRPGFRILRAAARPAVPGVAGSGVIQS